MKDLDYEEYIDEHGFRGPLPASHGQRRLPDEGFFSGPEIGDALPNFTLKDQNGRSIDLHADRGDSKAAVVFYRSAVW